MDDFFLIKYYSTIIQCELIARNNVWIGLGLLLAPDT
jgi:hypothetical protein